MKISSAIGLAPSASLSQSRSSSSASFAALLASGQSIAGIRNERAFGFSETGLFGAARSTVQANMALSAPVKNIMQSEVSQRFLEAEAGSANAGRTNDTKPNSLSSNIGIQRAPSLNGLPITGAKASVQSLAASKLVLDSKPIRFLKLSGVEQHYVKNASYASGQRKRDLAVSGSDDALCVTISSFVTNGDDQNDLMTSLFSTTQQFGMILGLVRVIKFDVDSIANIKERKR